MKKTSTKSIGLGPYVISILILLVIIVASVAANAQGVASTTDMLTKHKIDGEIVFIEGSVYQDTDGDCGQSGDENGLKGWYVMAEGKETFYGKTDCEGNFTLTVPPGKYNVSLMPNGKVFEHAECSDNEQRINVGKKKARIAQLSFPILMGDELTAAAE